MSNNFEEAYAHIYASVLRVNPRTSEIHGLNHWRAVEANGVLLSAQNGANERVIRLFAIFHDACRRNDNFDPEHGTRAAKMVLRMRHQLPLSDEEVVLLLSACAWHSDGLVNKRDITIGTCWDADRLDLMRPGVGVSIDEKMLSTEAARLLLSQCRTGKL